ncbi:tRNA-processing RNAse BN [Mariprofundus aestuarium]|uniref:tRNA-processing RNAse BN n=1 Tax=Mariprofundus aestuarium TaxID=1921086 RepID=A0A2K8L2N8_MARES|nr:YihY family inner membrane protein [Mariprofundus aestuarium]ATX80111.1 tRNA-processing RNAse BN [Mariprofundus aestuarium]
MAGSKKPTIAQQLSKLLEMDVADIASLPSLYRHATHLFRFAYRVVMRFIDDRCIQRASALAYASLLAIVPMVALGFSVFTSFQAFDAMAGSVSDSLLSYLLPTSQKAVQDYLGTVADKTTAISVFGVIGLLFTATALLNTIEEAFNDIWRITRARAWLSKFITFWATLTLAPILIGASITITSYFTALPVIKEVAEGASYISEAPFLVPWLMSSLAMATLYSVLPNTSVPFRYAAVGGLVAGALFEWAKFGFAFYVTEVANYERLYGALSTLPIFLIWIYLIWVIVLLGSEIAFCMQHPEQSHRQTSSFQKPGIRQFYSHLILLRSAQALHQGNTLNMDDLIDDTGLPSNILQEWLDQLCNIKLLRYTESSDEEPGWVPGFDAEQMSLYEIFVRLNETPMEVPEEWQGTSIGRQLAGLYFRLGRERSGLLKSMNIREIMEKEQERDDAREEVLKEYDT